MGWDIFLLVAQVAFVGGSFKYVFAPNLGEMIQIEFFKWVGSTTN